MQAAKNVLIVDDEESMQLLIARILASIPGLEVTLAGGGEDALRKAAGRAYDLILLDLLMPGMDGIEVLTRIRNESPNDSTPVIIVSVLADQPTIIVCRSLGVRDFVAKPVDRDALLAAVKAQLGADSTPCSEP